MTQRGLIYSNPNLLINADFQTNQYGLATTTGTTYAVNQYVVDRHYVFGGPFAADPNMFLNNGNFRMEINATDTADYGVYQGLETPTQYEGKVMTLTASIKANTTNEIGRASCRERV